MSDTRPVSRRVLRVLIVAWSSFAVAAVATMLFFAAFDPVLLAEAATFPVSMSRFAGYTAGFFSLWALTAAAGTICLFLASSLDTHKGS